MTCSGDRSGGIIDLSRVAKMRPHSVHDLLAPLLILCGMSLTLTGEHVRTQDSMFGVYSNLEAREGDISGHELFLVPSQDGPYLLYQEAEGWPGRPVLLKARIGGSDFADEDRLEFTHPELGPFEGQIAGEVLAGDFSESGITLRLTRGKSFWQ